MGKHTPGPWMAGIPGNNRVYGPDGDPDLAGPIAEACHRYDPAVRAANKHLIAAAPAMLDALKATTRILHTHIGQLDTGEIHELEIAKTVLAAAEPEEGQ